VKDFEELERFEKLVGQLRGVYEEIGLLAKKTPHDAVNTFKLCIVNKIISSANTLLESSYLPFDDFQAFDTDDMPTNSDVGVVIAQYLEEAERYRSDNIALYGGTWWYIVDDVRSDVRTGAPAKVTRK